MNQTSKVSKLALTGSLLALAACTSSPRITNLDEATCKGQFLSALTDHLAVHEPEPGLIAQRTVDGFLAVGLQPGRFTLAGPSGRVYSLAVRTRGNAPVLVVTDVTLPHAGFTSPPGNRDSEPTGSLRNKTSPSDEFVTSTDSKHKSLKGCVLDK